MNGQVENVNLRSFNKALPFDYESNPLHLDVNSDHATIKCKVDYSDSTSFTISGSNISNKEYHKYNKNGPLAKSHMYVPTNNSEWLLKKTKFQLDQLVNEISTMDVQVILEGFYDFFDDFQKILKDETKYELISVLDNPDHKFKNSPKNIAGILVNTSRVLITDRGVETIYYENSKNSSFQLPWVKIKSNNHELVIFAVHLPGNDDQFPKSAIIALHDFMNSFKHKSDVIAIGDFNTVPDNIQMVTTNFKVLEPKYLTHFNPYNEVVVYDNVLYHLNSTETKISLLDQENLPNDSIKLIESLNNSYSRKKLNKNEL